MYVQNCVVDKIRDAFPHLSWIADKKVQDGCPKTTRFQRKKKMNEIIALVSCYVNFNIGKIMRQI